VPHFACEKRAINWSDASEDASDWDRHRVEAHGSIHLASKTVVRKKRAQRAIRKYAQVGHRGALVPRAIERVHRIADDDFVAHVRGRGLLTKDERDDVVKAREIVGRKNGVASGRQQSPELGDECVGRVKMFDDLIGDDHVERTIGKRNVAVEVGTHDRNAFGSALLRRFRHDFQTAHGLGLDLRRHPHGQFAVVATHVEESGGAIGNEKIENDLAVLLLCRTKISFEIAHADLPTLPR